MRSRRILKPVIFILALIPLAWLIWRGAAGDLGANPPETIDRFLGDWALRFLILTLALTPAKRFLGWTSGMSLRRMLGLFAFFYASLHVTGYLVVNLGLNLEDFIKDVVKRTFITVGMGVYLCLLSLALTSTSRMVKRLGAARWKALHRLIYPAALAACLHYFMMIKADHLLPLLHLLVVIALLGARLVQVPPPAKMNET